jgi:hypothetical protein
MRTISGLIFWLVVLLVVLTPFTYLIFGIGGCGPTRTVQDATVNRLYVDVSSNESHYMVGTDKGVFEVDNGLILWIWNSDEIYSSIQEGKAYNFTTKGNKIVNMFFQRYPYIINVHPVSK